MKSFVINLLCLLPSILSLEVTPADLNEIVQMTILRGPVRNNVSIHAFNDLKRRLKENNPPPSCRDLKKTFPDAIKTNHSAELCSELVEKCPTTQQLAQLTSDSQSLTEAIQKICPILLFEPLCNLKPEKGPQIKSSNSEVWVYAIVSVTIISCTSLVGVVIVPFLNTKSYFNVINLFEGLAVGSLTGSAIFHLIPQSFNLLISESKHDYLWKALVIFGGIYLFYWSERVMNIIMFSDE